MSSLEKCYASVGVCASEVDSAEGKQQVIAELYDRFFRSAFRNRTLMSGSDCGEREQSEAFGIVYTPTEIVDFALRAVDHVPKETFGRGLNDEDVHILDPFIMRKSGVSRGN